MCTFSNIFFTNLQSAIVQDNNHCYAAESTSAVSANRRVGAVSVSGVPARVGAVAAGAAAARPPRASRAWCLTPTYPSAYCYAKGKTCCY